MQDHKVFARNKFGTFEVPKKFLNTHQNSPAAVAPKAVRQARRACVFPPWHDTRHSARTSWLICFPSRSYTNSSVYLLCITHISIECTHAARLVHVQVSNAHGWHGVRRMARANEQQKQQEKLLQQQKLKQKHKKEQRQQQKQKQERKREQQQNGGGEAGALSIDGVEARIPHQPLAHAAYTHAAYTRVHTASSHVTVCWLSPVLTAGPLCA